MVALIAFALAAASLPGPVASFSVPSLVSVGQSVTYVDTSYDPAPGHAITLEIWLGREASFSSPGSYGVTLVVRDDRGLSDSVSHTVTVRAPAPPPPVNPPPRSPAATLEVSSRSLRRGDPLVVTLEDAPDAQDIHLALPTAFRTSLTLPTGPLDYAQVNQAAFSEYDGQWSTTVWVPWTSDIPADGTYPLTVDWTEAGVEESLETSVSISGTDTLAVFRAAQ